MDRKRRAASAKSANSASVENQTLRDTINASQHQLMKCREELSHARNQLKCLIHLVKRAWSGDIEASVHVANIVGIAPPDLQLRADTNEVVAVPKSAVLNNWACLTIGLLNREYSKDEKERKARQLAYFVEREKYLDSQLNGFIQQPEMRSSTDAATHLRSDMLKDLKNEQDLREKSYIDLQVELSEQKRKLADKQKSFKGSGHSKSWLAEDTRTKDEEEIDASGFYVDASQSQLTQKKIDPVKGPRERTVRDIQRVPSAKTTKPSPAVIKKTPQPKTAKPVGRDLKVEVKTKRPRPYSAKDSLATTIQGSSHVVSSGRRKSTEGSCQRGDYRLEQIERELKRTTSELQKKLNINPNGYLKF